jgi:hypothetical protein
MIAGNEIEAQPVSLCRFRSSHLIEESGASVALADGGVGNPLGAVGDKGNPLASLPIFALSALCLSQVLGDASSVSLAQSFPFSLSSGSIALAEDGK